MKYKRIIDLFRELIKEYSEIEGIGKSAEWDEVNSYSDEEIKEQVKQSLKFSIEHFKSLGLKLEEVDIDGDIVSEVWQDEKSELAYNRKYNARELYDILPEMLDDKIKVSLMNSAVEEERYEDAAFWRDAKINLDK